MPTSLILIIAFLVILLLWMSWRMVSLRRGMDSLTRAVRRAASGEQASPQLDTDHQALDELSGALQSLARHYEDRLEDLEVERARLAAVLEQMTDGVLIADANGRVRFANPAAEQLFNGGKTLIGYTVTESVRHHRLVETWRTCQDTREVQTESVEIPSRRQFLQLVAIPDEFEGGSLLLVQDLTRIRRLETVRRDFISNLSHEIRTPLASLKALAETLQEGALDDPPAARRFVNSMQTEVDALTQMANELLELSRIESGQVPLSFKPVNPFGLLETAAERMKAQAGRAGLTVSIDKNDSLPSVQADGPRIEQVLVNLLHNAIKFTHPGGQVRLSAGQEGEFVRFSVQDTGVGIPADDLPRIFERFYKIDRARTKGSAGGTGLGLSIARHIVESHGGRIWAESVEGKGSTFHFTLPIAP